MTSPVLRAIQDLCHSLGVSVEAEGLDDQSLLARYQRENDSASMAVLMGRYAPLVWGACSRMLQQDQDAEDAFQATFLVLMEKNASIRQRSVGGWLHGVACRVARSLQRKEARRRSREKKREKTSSREGSEIEWQEIRAAIDKAIQSLPESYRLPVVLCHLQGMTYREAAKALDCPEGTISGRLARAKVLLRDRLTRNGITAGALATAAFWQDLQAGSVTGADPAQLLDGCIGRSTAPEVQAMAGEILTKMTLTKWKAIAMTLLLLGLTGIGAGMLYPNPSIPLQREEKNQDQFGDPLPKGAVARLGTLRLRTGGGNNTIAFHPNGKALVSSGSDNSLRLWDLTTGKQRIHFGGHYPWVSGFALGPRGKVIASGGADGKVKLWSVATGKLIRAMGREGLKDPVYAIAFSPNGKQIAASAWGQGKIIYRFDAQTGAEIHSLTYQGGTISSLAYSPNGNFLAAGCSDDQVRIFDTSTGKVIKALAVNRAEKVDKVLVASDSRTIVACGGWFKPSIYIWDLKTGKRLHRISRMAPDCRPPALALTPDGKSLVAGESGGEVLVRSLATGKVTHRPGIRLVGEDIYRLTVSPNGSHLASAGYSSIRLWDLKTGRELLPFAANHIYIRNVAFSRNGKRIGTIAQDGTVMIWNRKGKRLEAIPPPKKLDLKDPKRPELWKRLQVLLHADFQEGFSADGRARVLIEKTKSGHYRGRLSDPDATKKVKEFQAPVPKDHPDSADGPGLITFFPDRKRLAVRLHAPETIRIWSLTTFKEESVITAPEDVEFSCIAISPNGKIMATGHAGLDNTVRLWDLEARKVVARLSGHEGMVQSLAFSPDGKYLASASQDTTVVLWDWKSFIKQ